jgi:hypothetical protein
MSFAQNELKINIQHLKLTIYIFTKKECTTKPIVRVDRTFFNETCVF